MANASTQTAGTVTTGAPAAQAAPAGSPAPSPAAPTAAPAGHDAWDKMGVSLDDLPIVGQEAGEPDKADTAADGGEPAKPEGQAAAEGGLKTKAGRVFKDSAELLETYENSSTEGLRLASDLKTMKVAHEALNAKLQEANAALMELQDYVGTAGIFPGAKTPDEVAAMTEEEKYNYYFTKREWENKRTAYSKRIEGAKKESEDYARSVKAAIADTEHTLAGDTVNYPGFTESAHLRAEILKNSPHLDNRSDTPYVTYFIAQGLLAGREKSESVRLEGESKKQAAAKAAAEAGQVAGAPSTGDKPAPKDTTGLDRTVQAFKARRAGF